MTTIFEYFSNRCMKAPPSSEPSQYSSPCPAANANTDNRLRHQPFFWLILKAVEALQTQNVNAMTKT